MRQLAIFAAATALAAATPAGAVALQFTLTGDYQASFVLDADPAPFDDNVGDRFRIIDIPLPGTVLGVADVTFYNSASQGGFQIYDFNAAALLVALTGPQLYGGTEDMPIFLTGRFSLQDLNGQGHYTLTVGGVGAPPPAVPEAATWAMFIGGLGLVGGTLRRRPRITMRFA